MGSLRVTVSWMAWSLEGMPERGQRMPAAAALAALAGTDTMDGGWLWSPYATSYEA
jgi:hypothetical protein